MAEVPVDAAKVVRCRELAAEVASDVQRFIDGHTSVGIERTTARAYGVHGADAEGTPLANTLVDRYHAAGLTGRGITYFLGRAILQGAGSIQRPPSNLRMGRKLEDPTTGPSPEEVEKALAPHTAAALKRIDDARDERQTERDSSLGRHRSNA
ncbi:MAG: lysine 5,6-aminomutase subunit alpha [Polyangiaceae bacterium]